MALGQAGDLVEDIGQDIDGVGHDDVDRVGRMLYDLRDDGLGDVDVGLRQIQTGLAGLTRNTGGQNDHVGALRVLIAAGIDRNRRTERHALTDVQRLAHRLGFVDVDHDNFRCNAVDRHGVGNGGTNAARADNRNFLSHMYSSYFRLRRNARP